MPLSSFSHWWGPLSRRLTPMVRAETASKLAPSQRALANTPCRGTSGARIAWLSAATQTWVRWFWGVGSSDGGAVQEGTPNPASVKCSTHVLTASKHGNGSLAIPCTMVVGPTCPVSPLSRLACGKESQSSDGERKRCRDSGHIVVWCNSHGLAETLPHAGIMAMRECFREVRPHTPQPAHQQQQPRCLWIFHSWNALEQS